MNELRDHQAVSIYHTIEQPFGLICRFSARVSGLQMKSVRPVEKTANPGKHWPQTENMSIRKPAVNKIIPSKALPCVTGYKINS